MKIHDQLYLDLDEVSAIYKDSEKNYWVVQFKNIAMPNISLNQDGAEAFIKIYETYVQEYHYGIYCEKKEEVEKEKSTAESDS